MSAEILRGEGAGAALAVRVGLEGADRLVEGADDPVIPSIILRESQ